MNRKLKHITAILLLAILPISAFGLNISIHKCKHKGTIHISFCESFSKQNANNCCSDAQSKNITESKNTLTCCAKKTESNNNTPSCCKTNSSNLAKTSIEKNNQDNDNSTKRYSSALCCSNSIVSSALVVAVNSVQNDKIVISIPINLNTFLDNLCLNSNHGVKLTLTQIRYPLKEPVCEIISYIHFTSNNSDEAGPNPQFVLYQIA